MISLVIICTLLLALVSIGCYYYYTRHDEIIRDYDGTRYLVLVLDI